MIVLGEPLFELTVGGLVLLLAFLTLLPWIARHTDFVPFARRHLRRFAPLYFVVGPSAIVYLAIGGTLSLLGMMGFVFVQGVMFRHSLMTQQEWIQHGIMTLFRWVEYLCSFYGTFGFAWLIRWVGLPRFWYGILVVSLGVTAAYRTARLDPGPGFSSGPGLVFRADWLDTVPVLLGMGYFLLCWGSRGQTLNQAQVNAVSTEASNATDSIASDETNAV